MEDFYLYIQFHAKKQKVILTNPNIDLNVLIGNLKHLQDNDGKYVFDMPNMDKDGTPIDYTLGKIDEDGQVLLLHAKRGKTEFCLLDYNVKSGDTIDLVADLKAGGKEFPDVSNHRSKTEKQINKAEQKKKKYRILKKIARSIKNKFNSKKDNSKKYNIPVVKNKSEHNIFDFKNESELDCKPPFPYEKHESDEIIPSIGFDKAVPDCEVSWCPVISDSVVQNDNNKTTCILQTDDIQMGMIDETKVHKENVDFSVSLPPSVKIGRKFIINVWAHLENQRAEVLSRVHQAMSKYDESPIVHTKGPICIERGQLLFVQVKFDNLQVDPIEDTILWDGDIANTSFLVDSKNISNEGINNGEIAVHLEGGMLIARIFIQIMVTSENVVKEPNVLSMKMINIAFASYANADRDEVLSRIQGMQKIAPGLKVFMDVVNLRSGDNWEKRLWQIILDCDVFYLFWSKNAKESEWVEKEWRYALEKRGSEFIDPVPLASPEEVPPPSELSEKHFNDWVLAFHRRRAEKKTEIEF